MRSSADLQSRCFRFGIWTKINTFKMRFYHSFTLSVLILIYLLSDNVLEAQRMGRYQWLKCKMNSKDPNCIEKKGPIIDVTGQPNRLPARVAKDIDHIDSSEESTESGDGSGDFSLFNFPKLRRNEREIIPEVLEKPIQNEEEGSAYASDYSNFIAPEIGNQLSAQDLREDNMIE